MLLSDTDLTAVAFDVETAVENNNPNGLLLTVLRHYGKTADAAARGKFPAENCTTGITRNVNRSPTVAEHKRLGWRNPQK